MKQVFQTEMEAGILKSKVKNYYQDQKNLELQWKEIKKLKPNNMSELDFLNLIQDIRMEKLKGSDGRC